MKYLIFLFLMFSSLAFSAEDINSKKIIFSSPLLSPEQAVEFAKKYMIKEKHVDIEKYNVDQVSFRYYASSNRPKDVDAFGWDLFFICKDETPGCHFSIFNSNVKDPRVTVTPGL